MADEVNENENGSEGNDAAQPGETKEQRFKRVAERRVNIVLKNFRLLCNLKSASYSSTSQQRDKIVSAIRSALGELEAAWAGEKPNKDAFSLD